MPMNVVGPDALIGEVIDGRYSVLELIATGGMASVYRAVDTRLDRDVALKVMRPHLAHDESFVARFRREARSAARLSHPNIVSVYDQGEDRGRVWLAMEYVPGRTLRHLVEDEGGLPPRAALDIEEALLLALNDAHQSGIIHRDVKPENVLIRDDGVVKVADFGLARAENTQTATSPTSEVLGTLAYISPEQVEGEMVTTRSDVYAAGLILFEMLTGRKAFPGDSIPNVLFQHVHSGVPAPSSLVPGLAPSLDSLVQHAAAKDPEDRPENAAEFLAEVRHVRRRLAAADLDTPNASVAPGSPAAAAGAPGMGRASTEAAGPQVAASPGSQGAAAPAGAVASGNGPAASDATAVLPAGPISADPGAHTQPFDLAQAAREAQTSRDAHSSRDAQAARDTHAHQASAGGRPAARTAAASSDRPGGPRPLAGGGPRGGQPVRELAPAPPRRRRGILAALLALLLAAGVGGGWYFTAGPGAPTTVPRLINLTSAEAIDALTRAHLDAKESEEFSETVDKGLVISATPSEGASLRRGADVVLTISKGKERYAVPDLANVTQKTATARLAKANLEPGAIRTEFSDTIAKGKVISFSPTTGTLLKRGEPVAMVVSGGPQPFDVPDFLGLSIEAAQELASEKNITLEVLDEPVFSTDYEKDTIAIQTPADGQVVRGDTVSVTLSKGPEMVKVPSVFQLSEADAVAKLKAAGFEVKVDKFLGGPLDVCTGQTPSGGQEAPKGSTVTITIV